MPLRKGQKVCNWILMHGWTNESVHCKLYYMTDEEFEEALKWEGVIHDKKERYHE